ncbi:MAG: hypothetical protein KAT23_02715 [Anaerolineales bacterium]|nr:hypothetical protein [Anaerolineales bacterium]
MKRACWATVIILLIAGSAYVVWADYTGPDRTTTEQVRAPRKDYWTCVKGDQTCKFQNPDNPCPDYGGYPPSTIFQKNYCGWIADSCYCTKAYRTVTVDLPPATVSGSFSCGTTGDNGWCCGGASIGLTANEPLSGEVITLIEGSPGVLCNPPDASSVSCSWTGGGEGSYSVNFWAHSSYGDTSGQSNTTWSLDSVPPGVSMGSSGGLPGGGGWYLTGPVTVYASGSDATSGVSSVGVSLGGGDWSTSTQVNGDGLHVVDLRAQDNAGNVANSTATVGIDGMAPTLTTSTSGNVGQAGWFVGKPVIISAVASDSLSGVAQIEHSLSGGAWVGGTSVEVTVEGTSTITFRARDIAGNEAVDTATVKVDTLEPSSHFTYPADGSESWVSGELALTGTSSDGTSGVSTVELSLDGGSTWRELNLQADEWSYVWSTLSVPNGVYIVLARAQDNAGNMESTARITVHVNNIQPTPTSLPPTPKSTDIPPTATTTTPAVIQESTATKTSPTLTQEPTATLEPGSILEPSPTATDIAKVAWAPETSDSTPVPFEPAGEPISGPISMIVWLWLWPAVTMIGLTVCFGFAKALDSRPRTLRRLRDDLARIQKFRN